MRDAIRAVAMLAVAIGVALAPGRAAWPAFTPEAELQSAVFRAKPAVVMISVRAEATVTVPCGDGRRATATPAIGWIGSGFIVHPDGWIATNGHVVQPFQEDNAPALADELLDQAASEACAAALAGLAPAARAARVRALADETAATGPVRVSKTLSVTLSNGEAHAAEIRVYSPPAYVETGTERGPDGRERGRHGRDVAILKIDARDLPVVELARRSTDLNLGQGLFVIGFPSVVVEHELLSQATRFEPSVTVGRVSGFKQDIGGQRVIQTDAAIIQGNSGGPAFDTRGRVVGAATFTSAQGDRIVQGFNFLIPVETVHEAAREAGITPRSESAFTRYWNRGVDLYLQDLHYRAFRNMTAADRLHPGFPDVERVREDCQIKHTEQGYLHREEVRWGLWGLGLVGAVAGLWFGGRRVARVSRSTLRRIVREELAAATHGSDSGSDPAAPRTGAARSPHEGGGRLTVQ